MNPLKVLAILLGVIGAVVMYQLCLLAMRDSVKIQDRIVVYTDATTNCQYLSLADHGGLTPRLDSTGHQMCPK